MKQQQTELQFEAPKTVRRPTAHRAGGRTCSSMRRDTQTHTVTDIAHLQKSALLLVSLAWSLLAKTKSDTNTNNNQTETRFELNWNRRMAANGDRAKKQWNSGQNTFPAQTSARHSKREPEKQRERRARRTLWEFELAWLLGPRHGQFAVVVVDQGCQVCVVSNVDRE